MLLGVQMQDLQVSSGAASPFLQLPNKLLENKLRVLSDTARKLWAASRDVRAESGCPCGARAANKMFRF
jgi:hypothetical protein